MIRISTPILNVIGIICINRGSNPKKLYLWILHVRWQILRIARVYIQPIELYINLYLILEKDGITYYPLFHLIIEATKYYDHSTNITLPCCTIITHYSINIKLNIKSPKGDQPIETANHYPIYWQLRPYNQFIVIHLCIINPIKLLPIFIESSLKYIINIFTRFLNVSVFWKDMCCFTINFSSYHITTQV